MRLNPLPHSIRRALATAALAARAPAAAPLAALATLGLLAGPAVAQDEGLAGTQSLETITVTGSNIRRVDIETSNPVITIDRAATWCSRCRR